MNIREKMEELTQELNKLGCSYLIIRYDAANQLHAVKRIRTMGDTYVLYTIASGALEVTEKHLTKAGGASMDELDPPDGDKKRYIG